MTDTPETQPIEGAEILRILRDIRAQARTNGEQLTKCLAELQSLALGQRNHTQTLAGIGEQLAGVAGDVARVAGVVDQAAPLLNSGPARALAGGGNLLKAVRATRRSGGGDG